MSRLIDEHRQYLSDPVRMACYSSALKTVVAPGDVVLDLGSGTGILGMLACRAGASRVYAVDDGPIIGLARELIQANGFNDRFTFVKGFSTDINLPEAVDVVVADQIGRFGFEAGIIEYFDDARRRHLAPGGRFVPSAIDLHVAAVEAPSLWDAVEFWATEPSGFDLEPARRIAVNTGYPATLRPGDLLGCAESSHRIDLTGPREDLMHYETSIPVQRNGTIHGFAGWFAATMADDVVMTNSPISANRINRRSTYFPIDQPVDVSSGDVMSVRLSVRPSDVMISSTIEIMSSGTLLGSFRSSTFNGMLLCKEDLELTAPSSRPKLSPRGLARRSVLELCDGSRSLADIEAELLRRHPDVIRSATDAGVFVAEVVTRYGV